MDIFSNNGVFSKFREVVLHSLVKWWDKLRSTILYLLHLREEREFCHPLHISLKTSFWKGIHPRNLAYQDPGTKLPRLEAEGALFVNGHWFSSGVGFGLGEGSPGPWRHPAC
jgi:hypothetical protein